MRDNHMFYWIKAEDKEEDCTNLVKNVMKEHLHFSEEDTDQILTDRAHRVAHLDKTKKATTYCGQISLPPRERKGKKSLI